jgi:hypothetical protein
MFKNMFTRSIDRGGFACKALKSAVFGLLCPLVVCNVGWGSGPFKMASHKRNLELTHVGGVEGGIFMKYRNGDIYRGGIC